MFLGRQSIVQPDGALWEAYDIQGGKAVFTSKGREFFRENPETWEAIHEYKKKAMGQKALGGSSVTREHFSSGGNSDVYSLTEDLVIKESRPTSGSLFYAVERLDRLLGVVEENVPRWIDIPNHYALMYGRGLKRQYMLMDKIDSGITVEQVVSPEGLSEKEAANIEKEFGGFSQGEIDEIEDRYVTAGIILSSAIADAGHDPQEFLTDWHPGNVLVEKLETPVAGSSVKMWVIDQ